MGGLQERILRTKCEHSLFEFYHIFKGFIAVITEIIVLCDTTPFWWQQNFDSWRSGLQSVTFQTIITYSCSSIFSFAKTLKTTIRRSGLLSLTNGATEFIDVCLTKAHGLFLFFFIDSRGRDRSWQMLPVMDDEVILKMIIAGLCLLGRKLCIDYITLLREPKCKWTGHTVIWCWLNRCYNSNWRKFIWTYVSSTSSFLQQNVKNYLRYKNDLCTNHMQIFFFRFDHGFLQWGKSGICFPQFS